jgi:hypothetical protein
MAAASPTERDRRHTALKFFKRNAVWPAVTYQIIKDFQTNLHDKRNNESASIRHLTWLPIIPSHRA